MRIQDPEPQLARHFQQFLQQSRQLRLAREIHAIGGRVLRNQIQLLRARGDQFPRLLQDRRRGPARPLAPDQRNRTIGAVVRAPLADLQIRRTGRPDPHARPVQPLEIGFRQRSSRVTLRAPAGALAVQQPQADFRQPRIIRESHPRIRRLQKSIQRRRAADPLHQASRRHQQRTPLFLPAPRQLRQHPRRLPARGVQKSARVDDAHVGGARIRRELEPRQGQTSQHSLRVHRILRAPQVHQAESHGTASHASPSARTATRFARPNSACSPAPLRRRARRPAMPRGRNSNRSNPARSSRSSETDG